MNKQIQRMREWLLPSHRRGKPALEIINEATTYTTGAAVIDETLNILDILSGVPDPEIPLINIVDLGIIRGYMLSDTLECRILLTPAYPECPAHPVIESDIEKALLAAGVRSVRIDKQYTPPWTSDWISPSGRKTLKTAGITLPQQQNG